MSSSESHGLPDPAIKAAHDGMHHVEQEQHEREAAMRRGLPDEAIDADREFMQGVERRASETSQTSATKSGSKIKRAIDKLMPGNN
ncbi:uncharacterized protein PG998_001737 [Apiospora kogelbergensis]|uniref:MT0933-like antitoxin protein n=1 Tax=Apiospora kogelbergensis TaxID=1337665 RepID=A0AAW0QQJ5_9PEZI